ncbi:MAG: SGNH hydrolase domain-containing protein, partial [Propionicimonas sp.]
SADRPPMDTWRRLADAGITILAMRDTPRFSDAPLECLARGGTSQGCGKPRAAVYRATNPLFEMPDRPARVVPIDLTSELCPQLWCPAEIGNVMVYRDKTHLTSTYVRTMTPNLLTALKQEAPWLF